MDDILFRQTVYKILSNPMYGPVSSDSTDSSLYHNKIAYPQNVLMALCTMHHILLPQTV